MDKIMRMHSVTSTIENGFVHLPDNAPWLADYLNELKSFPKRESSTTSATRRPKRSIG